MSLECKKLPHAGPGFRSCIRVRRTCGHTRVQPNFSSETKFFAPTPTTHARVGLVVKHVIRLQMLSQAFF
ncbi:hypothetical protein Hanom_Chr06g00536511 [Helianthus anomalus]